jgi:hypothetical protein
MKINLVDGITESEFGKLESAARRAFKSTVNGTKELGEAIIAVKAAANWERGQFEKWMKANSIDKQHAMYAMRVASGTQKPAKKQTAADNEAQTVVGQLSSNLYKLYELDAAGETDECNELARSLIREIETLFITEDEPENEL